MTGFIYTFDPEVVLSWKYCPYCGEDLLDMPIENAKGHIECSSGDCGESEVMEFTVRRKT